MSSPSFRFRQFVVWHDRCAHRVGTDGVLLGAWPRVQGARRVLDVGTGSGLVALMVAQRVAQARVVGIDVDGPSVGQAHRNVAESPFASRIDIQQADVRDFRSGEPFDCILCNPPFYVEDTLSPNDSRARARHAALLPFADLVASAERLLSADGAFHVILPCSAVNDFVTQCFMVGLVLVRHCQVRTVERKAPKRSLLSFARQGTVASEAEELVLHNPDGTRSEDYTMLTKDFYLW